MTNKVFTRSNVDLLSNKLTLFVAFGVMASFATYFEAILNNLTSLIHPSFLVAEGLLLMAFAPLVEEGIKILSYRKVNVPSGIALALAFTLGEAAMYMINQGAFATFSSLNIAQLVIRVVLPFHVLNYFTAKRYDFGKMGYTTSVAAHSAINGAFLLSMFTPFGLVADGLYALVYIILALNSWDQIFP